MKPKYDFCTVPAHAHLTESGARKCPKWRAAKLLGKAKSPRKAESSRQNGKKGGRPNLRALIEEARAAMHGVHNHLQRTLGPSDELRAFEAALRHIEDKD